MKNAKENKDVINQARLLLEAGYSPQKVLEALKKDGVDVTQFPEVLSLILSFLPKVSSQQTQEQAFEYLQDELDRRFILYADVQGRAVILKRGDGNTVSESSDEEAIGIGGKSLRDAGFKVMFNKTRELFQTWKMTAQKIHDFPKAFSFDPNVTAFNHIKIDVKDEPTPVFDQFAKRCSNALAMMAFVWSIFVEDCTLQQYLLLRGDGRDGKGSLLRFIEKLVGRRAFQGISPKDPYWVAKLVGKRVASFPDVNSTSFVLSSEFKAVTGGDRVTVTEKYQASYSAHLNVKIFISTNNEAEVTSRKSDQRRCIYVDIKGDTETIPNYEQKLWEERAGILFKCKQAYDQLFKQDENAIVCDQAELLEKSEEFEINFSAVLDDQFILGSDFKVICEQAYKKAMPNFKAPQEYAQFVRWLNRVHGVKKAQLKDSLSGKVRNYLVGMKLKFGGDQ